MAERSIAHYNILEKIGEGGLGTVYRARDTKVGRTVALKVLRGETADEAARADSVIADAHRAVPLNHPNIATLFEIGYAATNRYLSYEFVDGEPLRAVMRGQPMNPRRAIEITVQIADALAELDTADIVHGDLRPETIAITKKGAAKLLDSGLSRWTRGGSARFQAASDPSRLPPESVNVVPYLSPEQAIGGNEDGRSDLFSLATIFYEMVTGRNPFAAASPQDTVMNVISLHPPPASAANPEVPSELDAIVSRGMAKEISERQGSAVLFAAELRSIAAILDTRAGETVRDYTLPIDDQADRMPAGVWVAAAAALATVAAVIWWSFR